MDSDEIILAARGAAMNTYSLEDARESVRAHIDRAYNLAEVPKPEGPVYEQLVVDVTDKILRSYPYITSQEVALVAEAGVSGELGGRTKPSAAAFFGWLASYMGSDLRKETIRNFRRYRSDSEQRILSPDEVAELNRRAEVNAIRLLWDEYRTHGSILADHLDGYVAMACDGFLKRGYMKVTQENWQQAKAEAEKEAHRALGSSWIDRTLPYNPIFKTKRVMLEMCFRGLANAGYDLTINS